MTIVISEFMDQDAVAYLAARFPTLYDPGLVDAPERLAAMLPDTRALIVRNRTQVTADLIRLAPNMEVVGRLGVGLDNIDQEACQQRGIQVIPATGANAQAVAEYVLAMTLVTLRGAYGHGTSVGAGHWPRPALSQGREARGKVLGLVGLGDIGRLTARLASAVGLRVIAHDPFLAADAPVWNELQVSPLSLPELLARADVVSLHLPLTRQTRNLFDGERLGMMKAGAILINTARGGIVDEKALARALQAGHLSGAAVDVFEAEPLPAGSPLDGLANVWLTPHVAGLSVEANQRVSELIARELALALAPSSPERIS